MGPKVSLSSLQVEKYLLLSWISLDSLKNLLIINIMLQLSWICPYITQQSSYKYNLTIIIQPLNNNQKLITHPHINRLHFSLPLWRFNVISFISALDAFIIVEMHQDENRAKITRKPLKGKYINTKIIQRTKPNTSFSASEDREDKRKEEIERNITMKINEQSISFIAKKLEISFISNGQDRSLDSFDKMIIGVDEELDLEDNTEGQEPDFTFLYKEFQRLCKEQNKPKENSDSNIEDLLLVEEQKPQKQPNVWEENENSSLGSIIRQRLEQIKNLRQRNLVNLTGSDPNISMRLLGANLSEIHEQEIQHNSSLHPMDPIDEQFIDFVGKGQGPSKINISKIQESQVQKEEEKKTTLKSDVMKEAEQDEVVAMLENQLVSRGYQQEESLNQEQASINKKPKKQSFFKENYKPILYELQQNEQKKLESGQGGVAALLGRRYEWIKNRSDKSKNWKMRELRLIQKFREILQNAQVQFSEEEEHSGET